MRQLQVNEKVRLIQAVPERDIRSGSEGVVQSVWFSSPPAFEVEFHVEGRDQVEHALVGADYLEHCAESSWEK
jgi:hypothetical protein